MFNLRAVSRKAAYILLVVIVAAGIIFANHWVGEKFPPKQQQTPQISVNLDGKPSKPSEPQVVYIQGQNTSTREIVYLITIAEALKRSTKPRKNRSKPSKRKR